MPVSAKGGIRASTEKLSGPVRKNGRISVSAEKLLNPGQYRQMVESVRVPKNCPDSSEKWWNQCECRKIVESGPVSAKGGIRASTEKLSGPVRKNGRINGSAEKLLNPCQYRQKVESVRVPKNCQDQFGKMVESV